MRRLAALMYKANELPQKLEDQLRLSVELARCIVPANELPDMEKIHSVHAQLSRVCRGEFERAKKEET